MINLERLQKNKTKIVWFAVLFSMLLFFEPFKVTNPTNPFFNPDRFKFSDYRDQESLRVAFRKLFPPGTPKEFVDRVLIDAGGAVNHREFDVTQSDPKYRMIPYTEPANFFRKPIKKPYFHNVIFDENDKVINILAFGSPKIFWDQPANTELNEMKNTRQTK